MKRFLFFIIILLILKNLSFAQVTQFPQVYYTGQGPSGQLVRNSPDINGTVIGGLISKIGSDSKLINNTDPNYRNWVQVSLPSTSSTINNPNYGYMACGDYYARINEANNYAVVNTVSTPLTVRPCSGCTTQFVTYIPSGQNIYFGKNSILALTGNVTSGWYEVFLPTNYSQGTGWVSGSFLTFPVLQNYYIVGGRICDNTADCNSFGNINGASINIGSYGTTYSSSGFFEYKIPTSWSGIITCSHPNYNIVTPATDPYTAISHNYTQNFILSNDVACAAPLASINNPSGTNSVIMTCTSSGGSGGNILYKWYNGTSCSGSILGTNSTLAVTQTGDYSCKAYVQGYESTCYACSFGHATINLPTGSISGTVINPIISDGTGSIGDILMDCNVELYYAGTNVLAGSTTSLGGNFNFDGIPNQNFDIKAYYTSNNVTYSVKELNVPANTTASQLKLPGNLIEEIENLNVILSNQSCYLEDLGYSIPIDPYLTSNSSNYINSQNQIGDNESNVIESLERLCIAERLTKKYFDQSTIMNNEYVQSTEKLIKFIFSMIEIRNCENEIMKTVIHPFIDFVKYSIDQQINSSGSSYKNYYRIGLDMVADKLKNEISASSVYDDFKPEIDAILTENNLNASFMSETVNQINASVNNAATNNYSGNIQNTINNLSINLTNSLIKTDIARYKAIDDRTRPEVFQFFNYIFNLAFSCAPNEFTGLLAFGFNTINGAFLGASMYQSINRGNELLTESKESALNSFSRASNQNWNLYNTAIQSQRLQMTSSIVSEFENEYTNTMTDINNSNTSTFNQHLNELIKLNKKLNDTLFEELSGIKAALPFSNISDSMYAVYLKNTALTEPFVRCVHLASISYYFHTFDISVKDSLNYYSNNLFTADQLMLDELTNIESQLSTINTPPFLIVNNSNIPLVMYPDTDSLITVSIKNFGASNASNVYCKIIFTGPVTCSTDSIYIGNIGVNQNVNFSFNIHSQNISTNSSYYSITIFADSSVTNPKGGTISVSTQIPIKTFVFTGDGMWNNDNNWLEKNIPPTLLDWSAEIIIDPIANGECNLNVNQVITGAAKLTVKSNKKLTVVGDFIIQ